MSKPNPPTNAHLGNSLVPNILALPSNFPGPDIPGYLALSIGTKTSGFSWSDTVTKVKTWKITSQGIPSNGFFSPWYSQMGLAISQPWGPNLDQYHIAFVNVLQGGGDGWVCDFGLSSSQTPGPRNFRALPTALNSYSSGTAAFSRKAGNPHIMYILTAGGILRLYNVATGLFVDSIAGLLGYSPSWPLLGRPWTPNLNQWFMVNAKETWASGNNAATTRNAMFSLNLTSGLTQTWNTPVDDTYIGYGNYVTGDAQTQVWDLDSNTQVNYSKQFTQANGWGGSQATSHLAIMRGYWVGTNTNGSDLVPMPAGTISQVNPPFVFIGSSSITPFVPKYWGQSHASGNWWLQAPGTNQYYLQSNLGTPTSAPGPTTEQYALTFINPFLGTGHRLGFTYSNYTTISQVSNYWTQNHAHISHDGKLVIFGSEMLGGTRIDLFAIEVPTTPGQVPGFP